MDDEKKEIMLSSVCCLCLAPEVQIALSSNIDASDKYADILKLLLQYELIEFPNFTFNLCRECETKLKSINEFRKRSLSSYSTMVNLLFYQVLTVTEEEFDKIKEDQEKGANDICQLIYNTASELSFVEPGKAESPVIGNIDNLGNEPIFQCETEENFNHVAAAQMFRNDDLISKFDTEPLENNLTPIVTEKTPVKTMKPRLALNPEQERRKTLFNPYVCVTDIASSHKNIINKYLVSTVPEFKKKQKVSKRKKGEFYCKTCYELFYNPQQLINHKRKHPKKLKCEHCKKSFKVQSTLLFHIKSEHIKEIVQIKCPKCDKKYNDIYRFRSHMKRVHVHNYKCDICTRTYATQQKLDKHRNKTHNSIWIAT